MTSTTTSRPALKMFAKIEMDGDMPTAPATTVAPPAATPKPLTFEERRERVVEDREAATAAGFKVATTLFAEGTEVVQLGVENATLSRQAWEKLPEAGKALRELGRRVRAEQREDLVVPSRAVELVGPLGDTVRLAADCDSHAGTEYRLETMGMDEDDEGRKIKGPMSAFDLLCRAQGFGNGASFLRDCSADLRKSTFNARVGEAKPSEMKLRTRTVGGNRGIFAVTGPKYQPLDPDLVVETIAANVPEGARAEVVYHQTEARGVADILFHSDVRPDDYACGEIFKAGFRVRWDDCSRGALNIDALVWRNLCLNLIIVDLAALKLAKVVHAGDFAKRLQAVAAGLSKGTEAIGHFLKRWGFAKADVLDPQAGRVQVVPSKVEDAKTWAECSTEERLAGVFQGLATTGRVPVLVKQIPGLVDAYRKDALTSGDTITRAGVVNALTRYAHESMDRWSGDALERAAGQLTWAQGPVAFQYVSVLG